MIISSTELPGVMVVEIEPNADSRGAFARLYCEREMAEVIGHRHIVQINHSRTVSVGSIRGLHFQHSPHAEMKLISCLKGCVWDVAVDLRPNSPTFLKWHSEELSPERGCMMVIPEGCAHGFQVLKPDSELLYFHTNFYEPTAEGGISYDDPQLGVSWPLPVTDLSPRDSQHSFIESDFPGVFV